MAPTKGNRMQFIIYGRSPINLPTSLIPNLEGSKLMDTKDLTLGLTLSQQERRASSLWWSNLPKSDKLRYTNTYFHDWTLEMVDNSTSAVLRVWKGEGNKL